MLAQYEKNNSPKYEKQEAKVYDLKNYFNTYIPDNVKNRLEIVPVRWIDKVLEIALERKPVPLSDEEAAPAPAVAVAEGVKDSSVVKH
jgi:predicted ATP-dependent protease